MVIGNTPSQGSGRNSIFSAGGLFMSGGYTGRGAHSDLPSGMVLLDRFVIRKRVGEGAFSSVYAAVDQVRKEQVALKVVELGPVTPGDAADWIKRELEAQEEVTDFRHILRMHDIHIVPMGGSALLLLSMEFAEGGDFRNWLKTNANNRPLRRTEGLALFEQACLGVAALHRAGTLHLDIKPENLLMVNGVLKVSDFGSALRIRKARYVTGLSREAPSSCPGTPTYMAPERFNVQNSKDLLPQADIYALGVIAYETLSMDCHPPFTGSDEQLYESHRLTPPPPILEIPIPMAKMIARCLEKDPTRRYSSVEDLLADLGGDNNGIDPAQSWSGSEHVCSLFMRKEYHLAALRCRQILEKDPGHFEARAMLEEIQQRKNLAERYYATIRSETGRRRLRDLLFLANKAMDIYPNHPEERLVLDDFELRINEYRESVLGAAESLERERLKEALLHFKHSRELNPGSIRVAQNIENLHQAIRASGNFRREGK